MANPEMTSEIGGARGPKRPRGREILNINSLIGAAVLAALASSTARADDRIFVGTANNDAQLQVVEEGEETTYLNYDRRPVTYLDSFFVESDNKLNFTISDGYDEAIVFSDTE
jgi:hypothetical protein